MQDLMYYKDEIWTERVTYFQAENDYYEKLAKESLTPLAGEVAKARQRLIESRDTFNECIVSCNQAVDTGAIKFIEKKVVEFEKTINSILDSLKALDLRVKKIEQAAPVGRPVKEIKVSESSQKAPENEDDDVDLFGSDSEEDEVAAKVKEERLAAYNAKKSKKPVLIAKSNVILDVKPWDDETDMKQLEEAVRKIELDGLLWGVSKLVPLAYGIHKLQIACVVEDDKVSIDWLTEQIEANEDFVQSVDIAAFNKI